MDSMPESSLCLQDLVNSSGGGQVPESSSSLEQPLLLHHEPISHHEPLEKLKRGEYYHLVVTGSVIIDTTKIIGSGP
ncbi:unnamed protein product [Nezara viridula]|uniref:Uncharacterized protein n=1 Tax=Nezara viridula TaxID=85310 RepID=A0A9P0HPW1_NEZVI|nr:unnamed protein product [Nezara viridula]